MTVFRITKQRSQYLISKPSKLNPIVCFSFHTTGGFLRSNPLLSLIEQCKSLSQMKQIQSQMTITGLISDGFASSRLIAFSAISESRNMDYCVKVLCSVQNPGVFSWNIAIRGYSGSEKPKEALLLYRRMLGSEGTRPDNYTYPFLFKVCANLGLDYAGYQILGHVLQLGLDKDAFVRNALIHMFASVGELGLARKVFDESCVRNLVSWNSLINGYVRSGKPSEAIRAYQEMTIEGVKPDEVTMLGIVSSCSQLENLKLGREFHRYIEESGLKLTCSLANALMDMYAKCGDVEAAKVIFDNLEKKTVVSWTTMIVGYAKCGLLDTAMKLFGEMPEKNVVTWNAIIGSYVQAKQGKEALALFQQMQATNIVPDHVTMIHCLSACSQLGTLDVGMWIHHYAAKNNLPLNVALGTALVDMYAKCGNIRKALQVFDEMPGKNSLTWTAIIGGLAIHGYSRDALYYFSKMIGAGLRPDEITFLGVLSACCHGGLVEQGRQLFYQMESKFNLCPQLKHYSCMVDLLGRAGLLKEAEELIESMPMKADAVVWSALFFASRVHGNLTLAERAASKLLELDPRDSGIYVLLATMYKEANMVEKAQKVRKMMTERGVDKTPGSSSIEVNGIVHEFIVRDESHPRSEHIYQCLLMLTSQLGSFGFMPSVLTILDDLFLGFEVETQKAFSIADALHV